MDILKFKRDQYDANNNNMFTKAGLRTLHEAGPELKRTISGNLEDQTQVRY